MFYRALGGPGAVRITGAARSDSAHRLTLRQRIGLGDRESLVRPSFDGEVLALPEEIDCFPDPELNRAAYRWLAAWFAHVRPAGEPHASAAAQADPLRADLAALARAYGATRRALAAWPGLGPAWTALGTAARAIRPDRRPGTAEHAVEAVIRALLGGDPPGDALAKRFLAAVTATPPRLDGITAPRGYRTYLPVPVWGDIVDRGLSPPRSSDAAPGEAAGDADERRRKSDFRNSDQAERKDSLIFNRFEYLLSIAEMLNLNRAVDDDDPDAARQAADTVDEISVSDHSRKPSSRLRLDLDLAPAAPRPDELAAGLPYPEWDYRSGTYRKDYCRVLDAPASETGDDWQPDDAARRRIRRIRRQFEALRPRRRLLRGQRDGDELDLAAVIRAHADRASGSTSSDRVYRQSRNAERDLCVALLVDGSLSTDSFVDNRRVLDIEKESALALMHGLDALGDEHAVYAFSSRNRSAVSVTVLKAYDETLDDRVRRRVESLRPGHYTRIGAALRHVTAGLAARESRHRLLLVVTDGKPNDMDEYEGRYGVEDTRRAVEEARRAGLAVFGITIDRKARDYFPYLFGPGGFAIVGRVEKLPEALPAIYRQITR